MRVKITDAIHFHGHLCPGLVVGFRASSYAMKLLGYKDTIFSEAYQVVVENEVCGIDGVQVVTGCTIGNGSLIIDNQGKQAYNFVSKKTNQGIRLALRVPLWGEGESIELHQRVKMGTASELEKREFFSRRDRRGKELWEIDDNELFKVTEIEMVIPKTPRLYPFVRCSACGEEVMERWAAETGGRFFCRSCSER